METIRPRHTCAAGVSADTMAAIDDRDCSSQGRLPKVTTLFGT
jgi:hypothetical protein